MNERRRFLEVLGGSALLLACGSDAQSDRSRADGGSGGAGLVDAGCNPLFIPHLNSDQCSSKAGRFAIGLPADYAAEGLHKVPEAGSQVLIGRDSNGLFAMSSLCTHQCCNMNDADKGSIDNSASGPSITCACHGSVFAADGSVLVGPAFLPLDHYELSVGCDGGLYVDTSKTVPADVRLEA